mgnify:FL=1
MLNYINLNSKNKNYDIQNYAYFDEKLDVDAIDYYHSNSIARASKTMSDCKKVRFNFKKTGTEG